MKTTSAFSDVLNEMDAESGMWEQIRMPIRAIGSSMGAPLLLTSEQVMPSHEDVRQGGRHEQSIAVLLEPTVAHLGKAEDALDDKEGVLDHGA